MANRRHPFFAFGPCLLSTVAIAGSPAGALPQDQQPPPPGQGQQQPPPQRPNVPQRPNLPQQQQRPGMDQPQLRLPPNVEFVPNVVYASATNRDGSSHDLLLNAFFPKQSGEGALPAIIYIHGGGFTGGSRDIGNQYSAILAMGGYFTVTIDYRLLGDAPFPAAIHDCKAAVRFLRANAEELGIDPERIGVWGHSAGGHLSAFLGTAGNAPETHGEVGDFELADSSVSCVVDFFGPSDFTSLRQTRRADGEIRLFGEEGGVILEERERKLAEAGPLHWVDAADPPFLIIHGTEDRVVPIEQSRLLNEALVNAGVACELVEVEGGGHGIREPGVLSKAAEFFDKHLGGSAVQAFARLQQQATDRPIDQGQPQRVPPGEAQGPGGGGNPPGGGGDSEGD